MPGGKAHPSRSLSWVTAAAIGSFTFIGIAHAVHSDGQAVTDSEALQTVVANAIRDHQPIKLQSGTYSLSSTVRFRPAEGAQDVEGLTIEGAGPGNTVIRWTGPPDQSVFDFAGAKYAKISNFSVSGKAALADLDFAGHGSSGGILLENILFDNPARFSVRADNPSDNTGVSEVSFHNVYSERATVASFQIEGANSLNFNFYDSGCSHSAVCVSNLGRLDAPGAQNGGNFNWFGGSISDTPIGAGDDNHAAFIISTGNTYNFVGVRVEDSGTLFYTPGPSAASIMINWMGGWYFSSKNADTATRIVDYRAGGSFCSQRSLWASTGSFYFSPQTSLALFDGDKIRVGWGPKPNKVLSQYFDKVPKSVRLRINDVTQVK